MTRTLRGSCFSPVATPQTPPPPRGRVGRTPGSAEKERYPSEGGASIIMANDQCATCGGALEGGFVSTSNGSGLFWSHESSASRLRPKGLEVLVPTGFMGNFSANLAGHRCAHCGTVLLRLK